MEKVKIIAFTGAKGSGKDTVAAIVRRHRVVDYPVVRQLAFADPIKDKIQFLFGLNTVEEYDRFKRSTVTIDDPTKQTQWKSIKGRHLVREIGMMMRDYDSTQFTRYVENEFSRPINQLQKTLFLVTDLRFDNEYTMLRKNGALIVKVTRPDYEYDGHITERGFDDQLVDYHVNNRGSLQDLETEVYKMLFNLRNKV